MFLIAAMARELVQKPVMTEIQQMEEDAIQTVLDRLTDLIAVV